MITTILLLLQAAQAPPNRPADLPHCDQAAADRGVQQDMNMCAHRDFVIADAALNAQWKVTRETMKARDADWESDGARHDTRPGWFATLLEAQRAWLIYRDAQCRLDGYTARGGSLEPLLVSTCKTALTEARTNELKTLAESPG